MAEAGAVPAGRPAVDVARVVVASCFALSVVSAAGRAVVTATAGHGVVQTAMDVGSSLLSMTFSALVVWAYLRRGPALATDRGLAVRVAAPLATCLPLAVSILPATTVAPWRSLAGLALVCAGTAWAVWSLRHLATCLSIVPQARALVDSGPYRWVRHPLYLGELLAVAGFALRSGHWAGLALLLALAGLQAYRAGREESLLADRVPGYADYRGRTWRILPGVV